MLYETIKYIFPQIGNGEFRLEDHGNGAVIAAWTYSHPQPTLQELAATELPASKAVGIAAINADCRSRLIARYGPGEEQVSRAIGIYGAAEKSAMEFGIAATIDASNTASNAILAATTVAEVEAVTVQWPVI